MIIIFEIFFSVISLFCHLVDYALHNNIFISFFKIISFF